ncbi:hypothetical protein SAMD00019534_060040 [Acytostelium subglobosum LB1]|uniref:hypothetical protein n=1 Tax=Acytostelium subglobosum LB1 TaxID=1410327 RepID=UPI0006451770|nr:hypothetical protein SAMD00019534_060040 [Acytostelium subglobosum LB1]GAM22829.1 hypothetical protein SAMD00019534_060040 [Acytostelium subglobosum LB1]|eukprot:XP_012754056.1 hypothetical protein SAMD00019534_060040 [Acytostelium subglobosum LB1]
MDSPTITPVHTAKQTKAPKPKAETPTSSATTTTTKPTTILTSSSLIGADNILFSFESEKEKPRKKEAPVVVKPPKPKVCKVCQKKGHIAKECPTPDINKKCTNCNRIGHIAANCNIVILNFAKYQPPKPERRERKPRDEDSHNGVAHHGADSPTNGGMSSPKDNKDTHSPKMSSRKERSADPPAPSATPATSTSTTTTTTTTTTTSAPSSLAAATPSIEQLKLSKELTSRQVFITINEDADNTSQVAVDPKALVEFVQRSAITSVCLPVKSMYGQLYYSSEKYQDRVSTATADTLVQCIKALRDIGVQVPLSIAVQTDAIAAREHPEWCQVPLATTSTSGDSDATTSCTQCCLSNPDFRSYFVALFEELLVKMRELFGGVIDGFYFTGTGMGQLQSCQCVACIELLAKHGVVDRQSAASEDLVRGIYEDVANQFKTSLINLIRQDQQLQTTKKKNNSIPQRVYFGSSSHIDRASNCVSLDYDSRVDFSTISRHMRSVPALGVIPLMNEDVLCPGRTRRIPKTFETLLFQCHQSMMLTSRCALSMPMDCLSSSPVQRVVERVFKQMETRDVYHRNAKRVCDIAVFAPHDANAMHTLRAVSTLLEEAQYQFDIVDQTIELDELLAYRLVILPDVPCLDTEGWKKIQKFSESGALLVTGDACLERTTRKFSLPAKGMRYMNAASDFDTVQVPEKPAPVSGTSAKAAKSLGAGHISDVAATPGRDDDQLIMDIQNLTLSGRSIKIDGNGSADFVSLLNMTGGSAVLYARSQRVINCVHPLFRQYWQLGSATIGQLIHRLIRILLPHPMVAFKQLLVDGRARNLTTVVTRQHQPARSKQNPEETINRYVVHIVNANRFTVGADLSHECYEVAADTKPGQVIVNLPKDVQLDSVSCAGDLIVPNNEQLTYKVKGSTITIDLPALTKHSIILINFKP